MYCVRIKLIFYIMSGSDNRARARVGVESLLEAPAWWHCDRLPLNLRQPMRAEERGKQRTNHITTRYINGKSSKV